MSVITEKKSNIDKIKKRMMRREVTFVIYRDGINSEM